MSNDSFILEIRWRNGEQLPNLIGPFATKAEAAKWAALNAPRAGHTIRVLTYPYLQRQSDE